MRRVSAPAWLVAALALACSRPAGARDGLFDWVNDFQLSGRGELRFQKQLLSGTGQQTYYGQYWNTGPLEGQASLHCEGPLFLPGLSLQADITRTGGFGINDTRWAVTYGWDDGAVHYGDLNVGVTGGEFASFQKQIRGWQGDYKISEKLLVTGFFAKERGSVQHWSSRGNNTSGPYFLPYAPLIDGSEVVKVDEQGMRFGVDYVLHYQTGELWFETAVNPPRIIPDTSVISVSYQSYRGQRPASLMGSRLEWHPTPKLALGATFIEQKSQGGSEPTKDYDYREDWYQGSGSTGPFITSYRPILPDLLEAKTDQFVGNGTVGPFLATTKPIVTDVKAQYATDGQVLDSVVIKVNDVQQVEGIDYAVDYLQGRITFTQPPPATAAITVLYYYFVRDSLVVKIDGVLQAEDRDTTTPGSADYFANYTDGRIEFYRIVSPTATVMIDYYYAVPTSDGGLWSQGAGQRVLGMDMIFGLNKHIGITSEAALGRQLDQTGGLAFRTGIRADFNKLRIGTEYRSVDPSFAYVNTVGFQRREKGMNFQADYDFSDNIRSHLTLSDLDTDLGYSFGLSDYGYGYDSGSGYNYLSRAGGTYLGLGTPSPGARLRLPVISGGARSIDAGLVRQTSRDSSLTSSGLSTRAKRMDAGVDFDFPGWPQLRIGRQTMQNIGGTSSSDYGTWSLDFTYSPTQRRGPSRSRPGVMPGVAPGEVAAGLATPSVLAYGGSPQPTAMGTIGPLASQTMVPTTGGLMTNATPFGKTAPKLPAMRAQPQQAGPGRAQATDEKAGKQKRDRKRQAKKKGPTDREEALAEEQESLGVPSVASPDSAAAYSTTQATNAAAPQPKPAAVQPPTAPTAKQRPAPAAPASPAAGSLGPTLPPDFTNNPGRQPKGAPPTPPPGAEKAEEAAPPERPPGSDAEEGLTRMAARGLQWRNWQFRASHILGDQSSSTTSSDDEVTQNGTKTATTRLDFGWQPLDTLNLGANFGINTSDDTVALGRSSKGTMLQTGLQWRPSDKLSLTVARLTTDSTTLNYSTSALTDTKSRQDEAETTLRQDGYQDNSTRFTVHYQPFMKLGLDASLNLSKYLSFGSGGGFRADSDQRNWSLSGTYSLSDTWRLFGSMGETLIQYPPVDEEGGETRQTSQSYSTDSKNRDFALGINWGRLDGLNVSAQYRLLRGNSPTYAGYYGSGGTIPPIAGRQATGDEGPPSGRNDSTDISLDIAYPLSKRSTIHALIGRSKFLSSSWAADEDGVYQEYRNDSNKLDARVECEFRLNDTVALTGGWWFISNSGAQTGYSSGYGAAAGMGGADYNAHIFQFALNATFNRGGGAGARSTYQGYNMGRLGQARVGPTILGAGTLGGIGTYGGMGSGYGGGYSSGVGGAYGSGGSTGTYGTYGNYGGTYGGSTWGLGGTYGGGYGGYGGFGSPGW